MKALESAVEGLWDFKQNVSKPQKHLWNKIITFIFVVVIMFVMSIF